MYILLHRPHHGVCCCVFSASRELCWPRVCSLSAGLTSLPSYWTELGGRDWLRSGCAFRGVFGSGKHTRVRRTIAAEWGVRLCMVTAFPSFPCASPSRDMVWRDGVVNCASVVWLGSPSCRSSGSLSSCAKHTGSERAVRVTARRPGLPASRRVWRRPRRHRLSDYCCVFFFFMAVQV